MTFEAPPRRSLAPAIDYPSVFRSRKWWIISVTALVVATTLALTFRQTPLYEAEASVIVEPAGQTSGGTAPQERNMETERKLAGSLAIARLVADELDLAMDPRDLVEDLGVDVPPETEIITFRYLHPDPEEAQTRAQTFAEAYLEYRRDQVVGDLLSVSQSIEERSAALDEQLRDVERRIAQEPNAAARAALQTERDSLVSQKAVLGQQLAQLSPPEDLRIGQVVEPALVPESPARPRPLVNGGVALFIGLALGLGAALLREYLDDRLRGRGDLETYAGATVIAAVPAVPDWKREEEPVLVTVQDPESITAEAYRQLRTSVLFASSQRRIATLMITSCEPGEGKTATTANLGVVLARAGKKVIVVSSDLRKPRLHHFFAASNRVGLTNVLAGEAAVGEALQRVGIDNLRLLPSGPIPGNPAELLGSEQMWRVLAELRGAADFVLLDSAPVLAVADATALVGGVDAVLFVADAEKATRTLVAAARDQLDQVNARVVGAVFNNVDAAKAGSYPSYLYRAAGGDTRRVGERPSAPSKTG